MNLAKPFLLLTTILLINSCNSIPKKTEATVSLKNAYQENFYIGTALDTSQIKEKDVAVSSLIAKEFNSITAENCMKSMFIHPEKDKFDFKMADKYVAFGEKYNMFIHGHTLIWHSQLAPWLTQIKDSTSMSNAMTNHITTIVGKYKGRINSWDVVNEAFTSEALAGPFYAKLGPDYVAKCFTWAKEANSEVKLFYNDYNLDSQASKVTSVVDMVADFKKRAIPIDGIGSQMHIGYSYPDLTTISNTLSPLVGTGLLIHFSELDMSVNRDLVLTSFTTERSNAQKAKYKSLALRLCRGKSASK